jgi:hypothetical protein
MLRYVWTKPVPCAAVALGLGSFLFNRLCVAEYKERFSTCQGENAPTKPVPCAAVALTKVSQKRGCYAVTLNPL